MYFTDQIDQMYFTDQIDPKWRNRR